MRVLFLDDDENRHKRFRMNSIGRIVVHVRTADEAIAALRAGPAFDVAFLDHDLSFEAAAGMPRQNERTGCDVAKFIAEMSASDRPQRVTVHSFNPAGAKRMVDVLAAARIRVSHVPFSERTAP